MTQVTVLILGRTTEPWLLLLLLLLLLLRRAGRGQAGPDMDVC